MTMTAVSTKKQIKAMLRRCKSAGVQFALSYDANDLEQKLLSMGLRLGDNVVMHSSFDHLNGFRGEPQHLIDCILDIIGPNGHLLMMSLPYSGSARDYLAAGTPFNVKRTPSMMGIITESFRRRKGVLRSANPLHPVLAWGPRSAWLIEGHEDLPHSCGKGSPFEKMLELDFKALFFDVDVGVLTFMHYLEDLFKERTSVPLYVGQPAKATVIPASGEPKTVNVFPYSVEAGSKRDFASLFDRLESEGGIQRNRIGNTSLAVMSLRNLHQVAVSHVDAGALILDPQRLRTVANPTRGGFLRRSATTIRNELTSGRLAADTKRALKRAFAKSLEKRHHDSLPPEARAEIAHDRLGLPQSDPGPAAVIDASLTWLGVAQDQSASHDGGVARHYSLVSGWSASYPETTGYVIPTLLDTTDPARQEEMYARARRMLDWLVAIQLPDGGFQGGMIGATPVRSVTFNTGQILMGLSAGARLFGDAKYVQAMHAAAKWLVDSQDPDGCWRRNDSPFASVPEHTYDTHVAWGLLEAARVANDQEYGAVALANVRWAITHQRHNGWFGRCCLTKSTEPLTHTIGYTLRGVVEAYLFSKDEFFLRAARLTADALVNVIRADGYLPGRLRSDWSPAVMSVCLTGSVQIAHCWLLLYGLTGEISYLRAAQAANSYVRRTVRMNGPDHLRGGVKGSFPVDGDYGPFEYLDWAAKFLIDSNRLEMSLARPL